MPPAAGALIGAVASGLGTAALVGTGTVTVFGFTLGAVGAGILSGITSDALGAVHLRVDPDARPPP